MQIQCKISTPKASALSFALGLYENWFDILTEKSNFEGAQALKVLQLLPYKIQRKYVAILRSQHVKETQFTQLFVF